MAKDASAASTTSSASTGRSAGHGEGCEGAAACDEVHGFVRRGRDRFKPSVAACCARQNQHTSKSAHVKISAQQNQNTPKSHAKIKTLPMAADSYRFLRLI
ncbi:hypothetical protein [Bifidobacterium margollesii]|uniref:hypothetical protein n=1 Tax=Bifidobacterium margollesii TaxID=2020964 RepID=UPI0010552A6B|nr:hypothetical protein [Bifidobacterium margollesii]